MSEGKAEISAVLSLDDHATKTLEKVKEGFSHVKEGVGEAKSELIGFAKQAAIVAVGFNFMNGVDSIREFAHEVMEASLEEKAQQKALAGTLLLTDQMGYSAEKLKNTAGEISDEFEQLAMETGASKDEMLQAFSAVAERSSKTTEEVKEFTAQMVYAGKAVSGGMQAIGQGFSMIEMGNVRASNAVVKLIAAQHLLKGTARDIAREMQKMTDESRIELAERAVTMMAEKMKPKPGQDLGYKQVIAALDEARGHLFEVLGDPIVAQLSKQLNRIHRYFLENQATIEHWAQVAGDKIGEFLDIVAEKMENGFKYIQNHAEEIKAAIVEAWQFAKGVMEFIVDHKEALLLGYRGSNIVKGGMAALQFGQGLAGPGAGMLAGGAALAALTAALVSWATAADQFVKLQRETNGFKSDEQMDKDAQMERLSQMSNKIGPLSKDELAQWDSLRSKVLAHSVALGEDSAATGAAVQALWQHHLALDNQADLLRQTAEQGDDYNFVYLWDQAVKANDQGMMQYAADVIAGSEKLQIAFMSGATHIEGGFDKLGELVKGKSEDFAKILHVMANSSDMDAKGKQKPIHYDFRGSTFQIKQDFRDDDPDRVALVFRQDIMRHTENRLQSRTAMDSGF